MSCTGNKSIMAGFNCSSINSMDWDPDSVFLIEFGVGIWRGRKDDGKVVFFLLSIGYVPDIFINKRYELC